MKLRKIEILIVFLCALAALLCGMGHCAAAYVFVISSSIGLADSLKHRVVSASFINSIFLILNVYTILSR